MQKPLDFHDLFRHMAWADSTVWRAIFAHEPAQDDQCLHNLLHHLHNVQHAFLRVWRNDAMEFPKASDFASLAAIAEWARDYHQKATDYLKTFNQLPLGEPVVVPWSAAIAKRFGKQPQAPSLAETMLQVNMHSAYHRGQVNARLRELGGEPPLVDFIAWVWFGKPAAEWGMDEELN